MILNRPQSYVTDDVPLRNILDSHDRAFEALSLARGLYNPSWTCDAKDGPDVGNGILRGEYAVWGFLCFVTIFLKWGSSTLPGASGQYWQFSLPFEVALTENGFCGAGTIYDLGTSVRPATFIVGSQQGKKSTGYVVCNTGNVGPGAPMTWAEGDELKVSAMFPILRGA